MKKRSLKNLKLEKNVISNLSAIAHTIKGGGTTLHHNGCQGTSETSIRPDVCKVYCESEPC